MASKMLGRVPCVEPNCGFQSAHIKINIDTEGKKPYRHCPECGAQYFPRTQRQADNMMSTMRQEAGSEQNNSKPAASVQEPELPVPGGASVPDKKYKTVLGVRVEL